MGNKLNGWIKLGILWELYEKLIIKYILRKYSKKHSSLWRL